MTSPSLMISNVVSVSRICWSSWQNRLSPTIVCRRSLSWNTAAGTGCTRSLGWYNIVAFDVAYVSLGNWISTDVSGITLCRIFMSCCLAKTPDAPLSPRRFGTGGGLGVGGWVNTLLIIDLPSTPGPQLRPWTPSINPGPVAFFWSVVHAGLLFMCVHSLPLWLLCHPWKKQYLFGPFGGVCPGGGVVALGVGDPAFLVTASTLVFSATIMLRMSFSN